MFALRGIFLTLVMVGGLPKETEAYKIAFLSGNVGSHVIMVGRLAELFVNKGHDVTFVLPSNSKVPEEIGTLKMKELRFHCTEVMAPVKCKVLFNEMAFNPSWRTQLKAMDPKNFDSHFEIGYNLLESTDIMEKMSKEKFDFIVVDLAIVTYMVLPYKLGIPYGIYGVECFGHVRRIPIMPSYVPMAMTHYSDEMSFFERWINAIFTMSPLVALFGPPDISSKYVPELPPMDVKGLTKNASLCLLMREHLIDFVRPDMPDVIPMGALMGRAAKPLKGAFQTILTSANDGAILVSFGSGIEELPENVLNKFMTAFKELKQHIIFKYKHPIADLPKNVHVVTWTPQNDLLGHPNLKLFISHCGMNSYIEAVYQGVPVLGFPFALDQYSNGALIKAKGFGEILQINDFTSDQLYATINKLLNDKRYKESAQKLSSIYTEVAASGLRDPVFWVEHVIKYGASHLRSHAYEMPDYQYLMIDVMAFLTGVAVTVVLLLFTLCRCFIRCVCRGNQGKIKKE